MHSGWSEIESIRDTLWQAVCGGNGLQKSVAIFGAGYHGGLLRDRLLKVGAEVKYFVDNDTAKQGATVHGTKVVGLKDVHRDPPELIFIAARTAVRQIKAQLAEESLAAMSTDSFTIMNDFDRFTEVRDLLADEKSKQVYDKIIKAMLTDDHGHYADVFEGNQYLALPRFAFPARDHFVDAGAFVGDTVERLLWASVGSVDRIYAFEPGLPQVTALRRRMTRLIEEWALVPEQVECLQAGLGAATGQAPFDTKPGGMLAGGSFKTLHTSGQIDVYALDEFLNGRPATFIKADVEGMELDLLSGAKKTIQTFRPRLALCLYHDPTHLYAIPLFVRTLLPDYRMAIRHHSPHFWETVLYCWTE
jgi:FkbM family methyltransferase